MEKTQLTLKDVSGDTMTVLLPEKDDEHTLLVTLTSDGFGAPKGTSLSFYLADDDAAKLASFLFSWMAARAKRLVDMAYRSRVRKGGR